LLRLIEAVENPERSWDGKAHRIEEWINHPFPNMAEPDRQLLHITAARPMTAAPSGESAPGLRDRPPSDTRRIAQLVDRASLHAVDRYFAQIRRELAGLERG